MKEQQPNSKFIQLIARWVLLLLACYSGNVFAVACDAVFTNGAQSHLADKGKIDAGAGAVITGGSRDLDTPDLKMKKWNPATCGGQDCRATTESAAASSPAFQFGSGVDGDIELGWLGFGIYPEGDYGDVIVDNGEYLFFSTDGGTYFFKDFEINYQGNVYLAPGDYWINGDLTLHNEAQLAPLGAGTIRIFVNGDVEFGYQSGTSAFAADQLLIYATDDIVFGNEVNVSGFLYAEDRLKTSYRSTVTGGVSGSTVVLGQDSTINYQPSALDSGDWGVFCSNDIPDHYTIEVSANGITCEAESVTITARDANGAAMAPAAGTEITLSTTPNTGTWAKGATQTFNGPETFVTNALRQTTPATLSLHVTDGTASEDVSPQITFDDVGLSFFRNTTEASVAGVKDSYTMLRVVKTDDETGACVARLKNTTREVGLAYKCRDPNTCQSGQTLKFTDTNPDTILESYDNNDTVNNYTLVDLTFDANGFAPIPLEYSDVGKLQLHGKMTLPEEGDDPAITVEGSNNEFVVKPYTLTVVAVETTGGAANPAGADGFVAAGEDFTVRVEARNADGGVTPNFGEESTTESVRLELVNLEYPTGAGGDLGTLNGAQDSDFTLVADGLLQATGVSWNEVGSFTVKPLLADGDYMGAGGLIDDETVSGTIGRFYPHHFTLDGNGIKHYCGGFSYMDEPDMEIDYQLRARSLSGSVVTNYDNTDLAYAEVAQVSYLFEDAVTNNAYSFDSSRIPAIPTWDDGVVSVKKDTVGNLAEFGRLPSEQTDGPYDLNWGLNIDEVVGSVNLAPATAGVNCVTESNCKILGAGLDIRYGRFYIEDAFGPETAPLPVTFITEYWDGNNWVMSTDDSCTSIPLDAISYNGNTIAADAASRTVTIGDGSTVGDYKYSDFSKGVEFLAGSAGHFFTPPGQGNYKEGYEVKVEVDLSARDWLTYDWDQDGTPDSSLPPAFINFGHYRGHDRIIYWREVLQ